MRISEGPWLVLSCLLLLTVLIFEHFAEDAMICVKVLSLVVDVGVCFEAV